MPSTRSKSNSVDLTAVFSPKSKTRAAARQESVELGNQQTTTTTNRSSPGGPFSPGRGSPRQAKSPKQQEQEQEQRQSPRRNFVRKPLLLPDMHKGKQIKILPGYELGRVDTTNEPVGFLSRPTVSDTVEFESQSSPRTPPVPTPKNTTKRGRPATAQAKGKRKAASSPAKKGKGKQRQSSVTSSQESDPQLTSPHVEVALFKSAKDSESAPSEQEEAESGQEEDTTDDMPTPRPLRVRKAPQPARDTSLDVMQQFVNFEAGENESQEIDELEDDDDDAKQAGPVASTSGHGVTQSQDIAMSTDDDDDDAEAEARERARVEALLLSDTQKSRTQKLQQRQGLASPFTGTARSPASGRKRARRDETGGLVLQSDGAPYEDEDERELLLRIRRRKQAEAADKKAKKRAEPVSDDDREEANKRATKSASPAKSTTSVPHSKYFQGRNETGRIFWTAEEDEALAAGLLCYGPSWSRIIDSYGAQGSQSQVLKNRTVVSCKDRAINMKVAVLKAGSEMPAHLTLIQVPPSKMKNIPVRNQDQDDSE